MEKSTKDIRIKINTYEIIKYVGLILGCTLAVIGNAVNIIFISANDSRAALRIALVATTNALAIVLGIIAIVFSVLTANLKKELRRRAIAYRRHRQRSRRRREEEFDTPERDVENVPEEDSEKSDEKDTEEPEKAKDE